MAGASVSLNRRGQPPRAAGAKIGDGLNLK
jgi:hypothetical protein